MNNEINIQAASTIQHFYRIYRSEKLIYQKTGVCLKAQSQKNYYELLKRLKFATHLPGDEAKQIHAEKKYAQAILTPEELDLFQLLADRVFVFKHTTHQYDRIHASGDLLFSSLELARRNIDVPTHTPDHAGEDDYVFFSFGIEDKHASVLSPYFLDDAPHTIVGNWQKTLKNNPRALQGAWCNGHSFAYMCEQDFTPIKLGETYLFGNYQQALTGSAGVKYYKNLHFVRSNGMIASIKISKESEISYGPTLKYFNILRMIEFVRLAGPDFRKYFLENRKDPRLTGLLYNTLFHPGTSEFYIPYSYRLKRVVCKSNLDFFFDGLRFHIQTGNINVISRLLQRQEIDLNERCYSEKVGRKASSSDLTPLAYAVKKKQTALVKLFIEQGALADKEYYSYKHDAYRRPLQDAIEMHDFALIKTLCDTVSHKGHRHGSISFVSAVKKIDLLTAIAVDSPRLIFLYLCNKHYLDQTTLDQALHLACYYDYGWGVEILLEKGANPNQHLNYPSEKDFKHLFPSFTVSRDKTTALHIAVKFGRRAIVAQLLNKGANSNLPTLESGTLYCAGQGNTSLMLAASMICDILSKNLLSFKDLENTQQDGSLCARVYEKALPHVNEYLAIIQILVEKGANRNYVSGDGQSFYTLFHSSQKMRALLRKLESKLPAILPINSPDSTERIIDGALLQTIDSHRHYGIAIVTGIDEEGDRIFLMGKSQDYGSGNGLTLPGGAADFTREANLRETAIFVTGLQTEIALDQLLNTKKSQRPFFIFDRIIDKHHALLHAYLFDIDTAIQNLIPRSEDPEVKMTDHSIFREHIPSQFSNATFIKAKHVLLKKVPTSSGEWPLATFQQEPLSQIAGAVMAFFKEDETYNFEALFDWATSLQLDGSRRLTNAIAQNDYEAISSLIQQGIKTTSPTWHPLLVATATNQADMLNFLLKQDLEPLAAYINDWVDMVCESSGNEPPAEEVFLALFQKEQFHQDIELSSFRDLFEFACRKKYFALLQLLFDDYKEFIDAHLINNSCSFFPIANFELLKQQLKCLEYFLKASSNPQIMRGTIQKIVRVYEHLMEAQSCETSLIDKCLYLLKELFLRGAFCTRRDGKIYESIVRLHETSKKSADTSRHIDRLLSVILTEPCMQIAHCVWRNDYKRAAFLIRMDANNDSLIHWIVYDQHLLHYCKDEVGRDMMMHLASSGALPAIQKILIEIKRKASNPSLSSEAFYNLNKQDKLGRTALFLAVCQQHVDTASFLLSEGADASIETIEGLTPLHVAVASKNAAMIQLLEGHFSQCEATHTLLAQLPIIISTAPPSQEDDTAKSGDIDYAATLVKSLQARGLNCTFLRGAASENELTPSPSSLLHIILNCPKTGCGFSLESLQTFKASGGRVMVTVVEFAKYRNVSFKLQTIGYLKLAEQAIFLDEVDKGEAIRFVNNNREENSAKLLSLLERAQVIAVPPTVTLCSTPPAARAGNIISFGMLRQGKGISHVIKLAKLIKASHDPELQKKRIYIVGTVQEHKISNNGTTYDPTFYVLMKELYPQKHAELKHKSPKELKELLAIYRKDAQLKTALPIELCLDVEEFQLDELFSQCTYSFLPAYRGATLRNSSISVSIANQWITYSHIGEITPNLLKKHEAHGEAMVLLDDINYENYADRVLADIQQREKDKTLNLKTQNAAKKLAENILSPEGIAISHTKVYATFL